MNITELAIKYDRVTYLIVAIIALAGLFSYSSLSRDSMPPYTIRVCQVVTSFPGASPERVEQLITEKIEEVVQELPELDNVTSTSRTGVSIVEVELAANIEEKDLQGIWDRLRRKVDEIRSDLPSGIIGPLVEDDDVGVVYGIMIGLESDGFSFQELKNYAEDIRDDLIKLEDAAKVDISGIQEEQIFIEFDNAKLSETGLTAYQLQNLITSTNIVYPGGKVNLQEKRIVLEPTGKYEDVEDLAKTLIPLGNGQTVELGDITNIIRTYEDPSDQIVRINGQPGVTISVSLKDNASLTRLGEEINKKVELYNKTLPIGIRTLRTASQDNFVNKKISDFIENVIQSIVIVFGVMLLFLGLRTGLVVSSLIPLAMLMTLFLMNNFNIGLNQVSLAALIMALGMLVDNAIVVTESIMVKMENGEKATKAALDSSKELIFSLLISSLTTSAAFLAFFLAENTMGEIMGPLFVVITFALLSSWIMAMTFVTMLAVAFIRVKVKNQADGQNKENEKPPKKSIFDILNQYYIKILEFSLAHAVLMIIAIIVTFVGSLFLFPLIPFIFFPDSDRNLVTVDVELPNSTKIEYTNEIVNDIERFIEKNLLVNEERTQGIIDWTSFVGEGPFSYDLGYSQEQPETSYAHMLLNTSDASQNARIIESIGNYCFETHPDAEVTVELLASGGPKAPDVEVRVSGNSPEELMSIAESIKQKLTSIPFSQNVQDDWGPKSKKFIIDIDQDKANRAGLTNQDIALSLQTTLSGSNSGYFLEGDENIPIMMRSEGNLSIGVDQLEGLNIFSQNTGKNVPLVQVADIIPDWQYAKILRRDLFRTVTISCYARSGYTATDINDALNPWLEEQINGVWPIGYSYELGGESENSADALGAVFAKLPIAGFIMVMLLIIQFNSFRKTFMVLATIPLGLTGVILGLLLFNSYFGFMAFLGVISLAGIVINNAIVLIDRIDLEQNEFNRTPFEAIKAAAQQRFRPILLTTFTTTLGLIPLYLGGGLLWEPMAIAIMIGLLYATVITLLFIPLLYKVLFRVKAE